jgi:hypothetical protein
VAALNPPGRLLLALLAAAILSPGMHAAGAATVTATATDEQIKAVLVYRFSLFVDWPAETFAADSAPFVIGVVGSDSFTALLEEVVRGERVNDHPIQVRRLRAADAGNPVHILFVDSTGGAQLEQVVAALKGRGTLTVSDQNDAAQRGAMIQLANVDKRIRLRINVESARAAGLTVNSNLLRQADIVRSGTRE